MAVNELRESLEPAAKANLDQIDLCEFYKLVENGWDYDELSGFIWGCIESYDYSE